MASDGYYDGCEQSPWSFVLADIERLRPDPTSVNMADTIPERRARYSAKAAANRGALPVKAHCARCGTYGWTASDTGLCVMECEELAQIGGGESGNHPKSRSADEPGVDPGCGRTWCARRGDAGILAKYNCLQCDAKDRLGNQTWP